MIRIRRLSSGYFHIRGAGPTNYAQVPEWPCTADQLREGTFAEAGPGFREAAEQARLEAVRGHAV